MFLCGANGDWAKLEITYNHVRVRQPEPEVTYAGNFVAAGVSGVYGSPELHDPVTSRAERPPAYHSAVRYLKWA
jgi:hypothetical protein